VLQCRSLRYALLSAEFHVHIQRPSEEGETKTRERCLHLEK
jgi:hypothetical protein